MSNLNIETNIVNITQNSHQYVIPNLGGKTPVKFLLSDIRILKAQWAALIGTRDGRTYNRMVILHKDHDKNAKKNPFISIAKVYTSNGTKVIIYSPDNKIKLMHYNDEIDFANYYMLTDSEMAYLGHSSKDTNCQPMFGIVKKYYINNLSYLHFNLGQMSKV